MYRRGQPHLLTIRLGLLRRGVLHTLTSEGVGEFWSLATATSRQFSDVECACFPVTQTLYLLHAYQRTERILF